MLAASKSSLLPPRRNETAPRLNASEMGPPSRKSPYVGLPPLNAATHAASPRPCPWPRCRGAASGKFFVVRFQLLRRRRLYRAVIPEYVQRRPVSLGCELEPDCAGGREGVVVF